MAALDAEVIAISNGNRRDTENTRKALGISFHLVPGPNRQIQQEYGVYDDFKKRLKPATVIVDKQGFVRFKYVGRDDEDRPALSKVIAVLQSLK
jgi:peroxiredoxin